MGDRGDSFRKVISFKDCVGCKLVSVPLLYLVGLHTALKNFSLLKEYQAREIGRVSRLERAGLVVVPLICFFGGSLNLYLAMDILRRYQ